MLADAVEATSKTLSDPAPARIQGMVQRVINNIFIDGQLEECELTLKDLHLIAKSFNRILTGIFHSRVDYPEPILKEGAVGKKGDENLVKGPTKNSKNRSETDIEGSGGDLKRLGIS